ncbi:MAG: hypothetical protein P8X63_10680 [Desulfuromonadaceae bacterium]
MKKPITLFASLTLLLTATSPALAGVIDTTKVYHSGFLVLAFLGFCAMIVVAQLIPAIILLIGSLRHMAGEISRKRAHARINR